MAKSSLNPRINVPIQFWDKAVPSLTDAMQTAAFAFRLLAFSVPIAMRHMSDLTLEEQHHFWSAWIGLSEQTDFDDGYDPGENGDALDLLASTAEDAVAALCAVSDEPELKVVEG